MEDVLQLVSNHGAPAPWSPPSSPKKSTASSTSPPPSKDSKPTRSPVFSVLQKTAKLALSYRNGLSLQAACDAAKVEQKRQILELRMSEATSFAQWEEAARELDKLEGNDVWKRDPATGDYSANIIESRLRELDAARANCDLREMLFLVRHTLSRELGGMGSADLYRYSYTGTKRTIERYVESAVRTIELLVERTGSPAGLPAGMRVQDVLDELIDTRQNFGRSALMLSGGATYGMTHIGVVKALFEAKLLPRIISGASAGSIICAVLCTRTDEEVPQLLETFPYGDLAVFEEEGNEDSFAGHMRKLLTEGSWSNIQNLSRVMRDMLGDITFREAYNRTRRICNITVSSASIFELPQLLNYYTAPDVMIWSAVTVSCSVPVLFQAACLLVKDPVTGEHLPWNPSPQRWIDGSVDNDLPTSRLSEMFNVNHFIVSQVNPHIVPFLTRDDRLLTLEERAQANAPDSVTLSSAWKNLMSTLTTLAKDEAMYRLNFAAEMGVFPNLFTKLCSMLSQKYSGDITIIPEISFQDLPRILKNPTSDFMLKSCLIGEKATWPKLRRIRDHCAIELAIDRAIHDLRTRAAFSPSQVNLRRMGTRSGEVGQPMTKLHHRERRRSGGSLQLLVRQRQNRGEVEQIMTDNESRCGDDKDSKDSSDEEEGDMLELDVGRTRGGGAGVGGPRKRSVGGGNASGAAPVGGGSGRGGGGLLKPVLRRATRSHNALPVSFMSKLSTVECDPTTASRVVGVGQGSIADADGLEMVSAASELSRAAKPSFLTLASREDSYVEVVAPRKESPVAMTASTAAPRFDLLLSPTDEITIADSSVFDADVESQSDKYSVSSPDLDPAHPPSPPLEDGTGRTSQEEEESRREQGQRQRDLSAARRRSQSESCAIDVNDAKYAEVPDPYSGSDGDGIWD
ncbi:patatin family phospholipase [Magnaporthiopsis poae ATCC 64411]|uniref:Patatin family phospholipase n=1 Tax=Magnaporthiopsis poae (strain ATCC 64411 / 73-15) TaxID=644358 RepID=A0A0C4DSC5_MAGP6|nr:patatin family phospholipase [Magnaporthiopsis poae ATCC 64411]